jgi:ABC-type polysaccharide/polyol phosphate transport system ATPase subunit
MARYRDIPTNILKENIEILIEFIDIGEFIYEPVRTYSTGMRLRLGISLLKLIKPGFIIMDEGIGAGDRRFVNKAYSLVEEKISQASGILISSHNLSIIDKFTDKTIILDRGAIRFFGDTNEALDIYRSEN